MDPLVAVVGLAVVALAVAWFLLRRRTPPPQDDEWTLPPEAEAGMPGPGVGPPPALDREMLLHRDRVLDPSKWDNSPDAGEPDTDEEAGQDDLPRFFDREYLQQRERRDDTQP